MQAPFISLNIYFILFVLSSAHGGCHPEWRLPRALGVSSCVSWTMLPLEKCLANWNVLFCCIVIVWRVCDI